MDNINKSNVFYLFIDQGNPSNKKQKDSYSKYDDYVEKEISFSSQFPKSTIIQIIKNKDYGLKEMILQKRSFNYESYFFNGGLFLNN